MFRQIIVPAILITVSVIAFFVYIDPMYGSALETQQQVTRHNEAIDKTQEIINLRDKLMSQYNSFSTEQLQKVRAMIPAESDRIRFIIGVNEIGREYGIRPQNISFDNQAASSNANNGGGDGRNTLTMNFEADGSYQRFVNFLQGLQQSGRLIDIQQVSVVSPGAESAESSMQYDISVQTYTMSN